MSKNPWLNTCAATPMVLLYVLILCQSFHAVFCFQVWSLLSFLDLTPIYDCFIQCGFESKIRINIIKMGAGVILFAVCGGSCILVGVWYMINSNAARYIGSLSIRSRFFCLRIVWLYATWMCREGIGHTATHTRAACVLLGGGCSLCGSLTNAAWLAQMEDLPPGGGGAPGAGELRAPRGPHRTLGILWT